MGVDESILNMMYMEDEKSNHNVYLLDGYDYPIISLTFFFLKRNNKIYLEKKRINRFCSMPDFKTPHALIYIPVHSENIDELFKYEEFRENRIPVLFFLVELTEAVLRKVLGFEKGYDLLYTDLVSSETFLSDDQVSLLLSFYLTVLQDVSMHFYESKREMYQKLERLYEKKYEKKNEKKNGIKPPK